MVTHEQLADYIALLVSNKLSEVYGEQNGQFYANEYNTIFKKTFTKNLALMPDETSKFHGVSAVLVIALFKSLKPENLTVDELKIIIMDIYDELMKTTNDRIVTRIDESDTPFKSFVEVMTTNPSPYENEYFNQETIQADECGFHLDIHRCLYFEILEANNLPELGIVLCEYDMLLAKSIEPWIKFERDETIASGFQRCTFRYSPK